MATFTIIDIVIRIITVLIIYGFTVEMYVGFVLTNNKRKFTGYVLALIVGIFTLIYNIGMVVILWLC